MEARMIYEKVSYAEADKYYINPYELAVQRGFAGSIDDWLASLKGEQGKIKKMTDATGGIIK